MIVMIKWDKEKKKIWNIFRDSDWSIVLGEIVGEMIVQWTVSKG